MIKKLMKSIGEYKKDTILTPVFVSLEVILEVIIPLLMAIVISFGCNHMKKSHKMKRNILVMLLTR